MLFSDLEALVCKFDTADSGQRGKVEGEKGVINLSQPGLFIQRGCSPGIGEKFLSNMFLPCTLFYES